MYLVACNYLLYDKLIEVPIAYKRMHVYGSNISRTMFHRNRCNHFLRKSEQSDGKITTPNQWFEQSKFVKKFVLIAAHETAIMLTG